MIKHAGLFLTASFCAGINVAVAAETWPTNLTQIGLTKSILTGINLNGVTVAVMDGWADSTNPDLAGHETTIKPYTGIFNSYDLHGTHVSGIIGATMNNGFGVVGVAPGVSILNLPVFDSRGWIATDLGKRALDIAKTNGAIAVNMSYGPTAPGDVFLNGELNLFDDYLNSMVIVRAAGNSGISARNEYYSGNASVSLANLLIVGSVDANNQISSFSTRPGSACIASTSSCTSANKMMNFFIVAPGRNILSDAPNGSTATLSGTSMATPEVTGAVALVQANASGKNTPLSPTQLASILKRSATDLGAKGVDPVYGWGLLNVAAALNPVGQTFVATGTNVSSGGTSTSSTSIAKSSALVGASSIAAAFDGSVFFDEFGRPFDASGLGKQTTEGQARANLAKLAGSLAALTTAGQDGNRGWSFMSTGETVANGAVSAYVVNDEKSRSVMGYGAPLGFFSQFTSATGGLTGGARLANQFFEGFGAVNKAFDRSFFASYDYAISDRVRFAGLASTGLGSLDQLDRASLLPAEAKGAGFVAGGVDVRLADRLSLLASFGLATENGAILGSETNGAYQFGSGALSQQVSLNLGYDLSPNQTISLFFDGALSRPTGARGELVSAMDPILAIRFGADFTTRGVFSPEDQLTLSVGRPLTAVGGKASLVVATGRELDGTVDYETRDISFAAGAPIQVGLAYRGHTGTLAYGIEGNVTNDFAENGRLDGQLNAALRLGF